jgi:hypothetical protein
MPAQFVTASSDSNQCRLFAHKTLGDAEGVLGSGKESALTPSRQTRVIARGDRCRPDLLLLADWAHALPKYQGAHCRPDDFRKRSPPTPLHRGLAP